MAVPDFLMPLWQWIETYALTSPELAGFGLIAAFTLTVMLCVIIARGLTAIASRAASILSGHAASRNPEPGYRVLIATPEGKGGTSARNFLEKAMAAHLAKFSFDAPFRLVRTELIIGGHDEAAVKVARRRLEHSDADMIIWGHRASSRNDGLRLYTLSRGGGKTADEALVETATLPGRLSQWNDTLAPIAAYLIARRLQPSLARPTDFRAERMEPVVEALDELLTVGAGTSPAVRDELERSFIAAALHVGEAGQGTKWLDRVIDIRTQTLEDLGNMPAAGIWTQVKLDLGRAMLLKAERQFSSKLVESGATHLREAVDVLKTDQVIRTAEDAMETLDKAQGLLQNRKRFSINFND